MVAYSFQRRFIAPIEAGTKSQTIRAVGKRRHAKTGDVLQLYFGQRTQYCRKIIADRPCTRVERVRINHGLKTVVLGEDGGPLLMRKWDLDLFAIADGFKDWEDLAQFWATFHPGVSFFDGLLIGWKPD